MWALTQGRRINYRKRIMRPISSSPARLARGLQYTIAATGSLAATWAAIPVAAAQPTVVLGANPWTGWNVNVAGGYRQFSTPTTISSESYSTDGAGGFLQVGVGRDVQMGRGIFGLHGD